MTGLDHFCLPGLAATTALMLALAASEYYPVRDSTPSVSQSVTLWRAETTKCDLGDYVCVLAEEGGAKAEGRQPKGRGHGYSEADRNDMNQLIARLP